MAQRRCKSPEAPQLTARLAKIADMNTAALQIIVAPEGESVEDRRASEPDAGPPTSGA